MAKGRGHPLQPSVHLPPEELLQSSSERRESQSILKTLTESRAVMSCHLLPSFERSRARMVCIILLKHCMAHDTHSRSEAAEAKKGAQHPYYYVCRTEAYGCNSGAQPQAGGEVLPRPHAGVTRENNCRGDAIQVSNVADRHSFRLKFLWRKLVKEIDEIRSGAWDESIRAKLNGVKLSVEPPIEPPQVNSEVEELQKVEDIPPQVSNYKHSAEDIGSMQKYRMMRFL